jgi:hypothetical protein
MNNANPFNSETTPIQFVFRVSRPLQATKYVWQTTEKSRPYPAVDIQRDFLYHFYAFSFSADISVLDYQSAIEVLDQGAAGNEPNANTLPTFSLYLEGAGKSPILRQPLGLPSYYANIDFRSWLKARTASGTGSAGNNLNSLTGEQVNNLKGGFQATLEQTPALIGKQNINMIMTLFAQEINSDTQSRRLSEGVS